MPTHTNDSKAEYYSRSIAHKNAHGHLWRAWELRINLAPAATYYAGMTTGVKQIELERFSVASDTEDSNINIYEGGAWSGGSALEITCLNRHLNLVLPAVSAGSGVNIDTPGVLIMPDVYRGQTGIFNEDQNSSLIDDVTIIFRASESYYFEIVNNDASARDYDIKWIMSTNE